MIYKTSTYKELIAQILKQTNLSEQESWWLLEFITGKTKSKLITENYNLSKTEQINLNTCINQISIKYKPLAYILGWIPFLDLELLVKPPILIPRPETENWTDQVICMIKKSNHDNLTILDIGTGSGCIAISLAKALPKCTIYGTDINPQALELAKINALKNNIKNIIFIESNLFANIPSNITFDLIVSNPPYIDPTTKLDRSVLEWEDHNALFTNNAGLFLIEQIIKQAPNHLKKNKKLEYQLIIEIDSSQGQILKKLSNHFYFKQIEIRKDQFERDRTAWIG